MKTVEILIEEIENLMERHENFHTDHSYGGETVMYISDKDGFMEELKKLIESFTKDTWIRACNQTLEDISITFLNNLDRAEKSSDKDVFLAIGETIKNFPISDYLP